MHGPANTSSSVNSDLLRLCPEGATHALAEQRSHRGQLVWAVIAIVPDGASIPLNGYGSQELAESTAQGLTTALRAAAEAEALEIQAREQREAQAATDELFAAMHARDRARRAEQIERLEDEFNAFAAKADEAPHRWGEEQEEHLGSLAARLRNLYDANGVADIDRISL